jgi:hypothetical protein
MMKTTSRPFRKDFYWDLLLQDKREQCTQGNLSDWPEETKKQAVYYTARKGVWYALAQASVYSLQSTNHVFCWVTGESAPCLAWVEIAVRWVGPSGMTANESSTGHWGLSETKWSLPSQCKLSGAVMAETRSPKPVVVALPQTMVKMVFADGGEFPWGTPQVFKVTRLSWRQSGWAPKKRLLG